MRNAVFAILAVVLHLAACGGETTKPSAPTAVTRRKVVWLEQPTLGDAFAQRLAAAGVDEVVLELGSVSLGAGTPVLRLNRLGEVSATLPIGVALELEQVGNAVERATVESLWRSLTAELGGLRPAEVVLDLKRVGPSTVEAVRTLREIAGVPVVPVLTVTQLREEAGLEVARAAGQCVVPAFGVQRSGLRGVADLAGDSLPKRLAPLAQAGVGVRVALALKPRTEPGLTEWGDSLDLLCEGDVTEIARTSSLDRSFIFRQPMRWSGRDWAKGETVAVEWFDVSRLNLALQATERLAVPDLLGWDLVPCAGGATSLGIGREAVVEYLRGGGPAPAIEVDVVRDGGDLVLSMVNSGPFTSAVSTYGNWLEVATASGTLLVEGRGDFERTIFGTRRHGEWQELNATAVDAVRFQEYFVDERETLRPGRIRLDTPGSRVTIRWQVVLTSGEEISGKRVE